MRLCDPTIFEILQEENTEGGYEIGFDLIGCNRG